MVMAWCSEYCLEKYKDRYRAKAGRQVGKQAASSRQKDTNTQAKKQTGIEHKQYIYSLFCMT